MLHYPLPGVVGGGLDLVLNEICARRVENLTFGLIKSPLNCWSRVARSLFSVYICVGEKVSGDWLA